MVRVLRHHELVAEAAIGLAARQSEQVDLSRLVTPLSQCTKVKPGRIKKSIVAKMQKEGFDQAPVPTPGAGIGWRLVDRSVLEQLVADGKELIPNDRSFIPDDLLRVRDVYVGLSGLLKVMSSRRAAIVCIDDDRIAGLLTISDLNRHEIRRVIFDLLFETETRLAGIAAAAAADPWQWIERLNEEEQARIVGYWELSRRRSVDVDPIEAASLTQLLRIIGRDRSLLKSLGFRSGNQFGDCTGKIGDLRNRVMHPVRPLVLGCEEAMRVREAVDDLLELRLRLQGRPELKSAE